MKQKFNVGDWVETKKTVGSIKKGSVAVVGEVGTNWEGTQADYNLVALNKHGNPINAWGCTEKDIKKVSAPQYLVAWSTPDTDPMQYFKNISAAKAFVKDLAKRKGYDKAIESGIYKRV